MKFVHSLSFILSALALSVGATTTTAEDVFSVMASLDVKVNFEWASTYKEFRVQYPGVKTGSESIEIKIYKVEDSSESEIHSFLVSQTERAIAKVYSFGLNDATEGKYGVKVCAGSKCSNIAEALTEVDAQNDGVKLTCYKNKYDKDYQLITANVETFDMTLESVEALPTGSDLSDAPKWKSTYKSQCSDVNPCYVSNGQTMYAAFMMDLKKFKNFFGFAYDKWMRKPENIDKVDATDMVSKSGNDDERTIAAEYCQRKYLIVANLHLQNKSTHEIKYHFKTTLSAESSASLRETFAFDKNAKNLPVELIYPNKKVDAGTYSLWISLCATAKDEINSTACTKSFIQDFTVSN